MKFIVFVKVSSWHYRQLGEFGLWSLARWYYHTRALCSDKIIVRVRS